MAVELDKVAVNFAGVVAGDENKITVELTCNAEVDENDLYVPGDYDIVAVVTDATGNYDVETVYANGKMHISTLGTVGTPVITYDPYNQQVVITPAESEEDATIYYSVNNGETWAEYTAPIAVTGNMTVQAYATKPGMDNSETATLNVQAVYTVTGTVTSYRHNEAVTVRLLDENDAVVAVAEVSQLTATEEDANLFQCTYTFQNIPAGEYTLEVSKKGHATREYTVTITDGAATQDVEIYLLGDINMSGVVEQADWIILRQHLLGNLTGEYALNDYQLCLADVDEDETVKQADWIILRQHLLGNINIHE